MRQLGDRTKTSTKPVRTQGRRPRSPALVDGKQGRQADKRAVRDGVESSLAPAPQYRIMRESVTADWVRLRLYLGDRKMALAEADVEWSDAAGWEARFNWAAACEVEPEMAAAFVAGLSRLAARARREAAALPRQTGARS